MWLVDRLHHLLRMVVFVGRLRESDGELSIHPCAHLERAVVISKRHCIDLVDRKRVNGVKRHRKLTERLHGSFAAVSI